MRAMVLAAGKGTRLFPLTGTLPEPVAPVADKPMIQHASGLLSRTGIDEAHVDAHHLAAVRKPALRRRRSSASPGAGRRTHRRVPIGERPLGYRQEQRGA